MMGMFDDLICDYPLPGNPPKLHWQTKSLECMMDTYRIDADGSIWHEDYDVENRSDPNAEGIDGFVGMCTKVNKRWTQLSEFRGEVVFYDSDKQTGWWEYSALFNEGRLLSVKAISEGGR